MPVPATPEQLLELVEKSNLIPQGQLAELAKSKAVRRAASVDQLARAMVEKGLLTHFQSEQLIKGKWRGFSIGKYKVLERLGSGGMGSVYLCEHMQMRHKVAVKVLPTSRSTDPSALGRFYREARAAASLNHPNLVHAHDVDKDGELHFLVMDYVEGVNLQQLIGRRKKPLSVLRACHYVFQAAQGLEHAHQAGLIHRDVKPANVLLDSQGVIRILDLGLARFYEDNQDLLTLKYDDKSLLGTADYVSPEQAVDSHGVDTRTDVYSLGATFYFLLAGHPPFPEGKVSQKLSWHQTREPHPIEELRPEVPVRLAATLSKMMAKNPQRRFQSMTEVVRALETYVQEPIAPPNESELPVLSLAARTSGTAETNESPRVPAPRPQRGSRAIQRRLTQPPPTVISDAAAKPDRRTKQLKTCSDSSSGSEDQNDLGETPLAKPYETLRVELSTRPTPFAETGPDADLLLKRKMPKRLSPTRRFISLLVMLICGGGIGAVLHWQFRTNAKTTNGPQAITWIVSRSSGENHAASVGEALRKAKPGDRIEIHADRWQETLTLDQSADGLKGVVLQGKSPSGAPVIWQASPEASADQPVWHLRGVKELQVMGFVLDGENRLDRLVKIEGDCAGLELNRIQLTGFRTSGLHFDRALATSAKPLMLRGLRFAPTRDAEQAVRITGGVKHVSIRQSRVEGPCSAGIVIDGSTEGLEIRENRFFALGDAVLVKESPKPTSINLRLIGNTFCEIRQSALRFECPPDGTASSISIQNNVAARTGRLGQIDNFVTQPRTAAQWIGPAQIDVDDGHALYCFRKTFTVSEDPSKAELNVVCDDGFTAWLNGKQIGSRRWNANRRRVSSFDVKELLQPGTNVLVIEGVKSDAGFGLLAELSMRNFFGQTESIVTDASWRAASEHRTDWHSPGFDDSRWMKSRVIARYGQGPNEWRNLVWDSKLREQLGPGFDRLFLSPSGNVRDVWSQEEFPSFEATPLQFQLPTDRDDDSKFLRYPKRSPVAKRRGE